MSYTSCRIGGVDVWVDPDNVTEDISPFGEVIPSLDGTMFVKYLNTNPANIGSLDRLNIGGVYLSTTAMLALKELTRSRTVVAVTGVPGLSNSDRYYISGMSQSPIKPAVVFPGDSWDTPPVRHSYNLQLIKVTMF